MAPAGGPTTIKRVDALTRFYAEMPDDELEAEKRVEQIEEALVAAVNSIGLGVYDESAAIVDWTALTEAEVLALGGEA